MKTSITCRFTVEAAHKLPMLPEGHRCRELHGHSYTIEFTVASKGWALAQFGMVADSASIKGIVAPILAKLDHHYLNELNDSIPEAEDVRRQPTAENIARWLWCRTRGLLSNGPAYKLTRIRVQETERLWAEVEEG